MKELATRSVMLFSLTCACLVILYACAASAEDCPKEAPKCKVLVFTPEEEQALLTLIDQTGVQGPYNQVKAAVEFWKKRIVEAPAGKPEKK